MLNQASAALRAAPRRGTASRPQSPNLRDVQPTLDVKTTSQAPDEVSDKILTLTAQYVKRQCVKLVHIILFAVDFNSIYLCMECANNDVIPPWLACRDFCFLGIPSSEGENSKQSISDDSILLSQLYRPSPSCD